MSARIAAVVVWALVLCGPPDAKGETFLVGPGEPYATLSQVAGRLLPGDIVHVTGDITDSVTLSRHGTWDRPITIRGVVRVEGGRIVRPRVILAGPGVTFTCEGDWNTLDGLDIAGAAAQTGKKSTGIVHDCDRLVVRNCYIHHFNFKGILGSATAGSITIEFCEFDSCGSTPLNGKAVDIWSWTPGATARVEHCYFHDALNECLLKTHCTRNVIRYNWFEGAWQQCLKVVDRIGGATPQRPEGIYPMHSDIVGNVFIQGYSPGSRSAVLSIGGAAEDEPGTEGDFNIAHNLFVMNRYVKGADETMYIVVNGNVDHIRLYNNVFLETGGPGGALYFRDMGWDVPETREFIRRRGSPDPIIEGANNWVYERSTGIPESVVKTLRGLNPKFMDFLDGDFHPRKDSPLVGAGLWPLPQGRIIDLTPEYEPQRGIPADLKAKVRRKVTPPSIGPFEAAE